MYCEGIKHCISEVPASQQPDLGSENSQEDTRTHRTRPRRGEEEKLKDFVVQSGCPLYHMGRRVFPLPVGSVEDRPLVGFVLGGAKKEEEIWDVPVVSICRLEGQMEAESFGDFGLIAQ